MRRRSCRLIEVARLVPLAGALVLGGQTLAQEQGATLPPGQVPAVLKTHEVDFIYRSSYNLLACDELRNHIAVILRAVGARDDVKVRAHECEVFIIPDEAQPPGAWDRRSSGPGSASWDPSNRSVDRWDRFGTARGDRYRAQTTPVHITVMMPVELTPEIMAEVDKDKARRDLVSRVTGNPAAALNDPILFPAERRQVTLSRQTIGLRPEDCELLEQMVPSVFRELDLKVVSRRLSCDGHQRSSFPPRLTVEALLPVGVPMPGELKEQERQRKNQPEQPPEPEQPAPTEQAPQPEQAQPDETPPQ
jgi:hypothetical protein